VVTAGYRHTSLLRSLRDRWDLGAPLTARDASAPSIAPVLSAPVPRDPADWPNAVPRPVPPFDMSVSLESRLHGLPRVALFGVLSLAKALGMPAPDINEDEEVSRDDGIAIILDVFGHMFPGLHGDG
jgi:phospholipase C